MQVLERIIDRVGERFSINYTKIYDPTGLLTNPDLSMLSLAEHL